MTTAERLAMCNALADELGRTARMLEIAVMELREMVEEARARIEAGDRLLMREAA